MGQWIQLCRWGIFLGIAISLVASARPYDRLAVQKSFIQLPSPQISPRLPQKLTLKEAILLALRTNPNVESDELQRVLDKFSLDAAHAAFAPQYNLAGAYNMQSGGSPTYDVNPTVTMATPIGTTITMGYDNTLTGGGGVASVGITQPLLQGAGKVAAIPLENALDSEEVNKLNFKNNIITVVVNVVNAYRTLLKDYSNLTIQKNALEQDRETLRQYELQLKYGKIARSELIQQQATLTQDELSYKQTQQGIYTDYQAFLTALGLRADINIEIDQTIPVDTQYKVPDLQESIEKALSGNIAYQSAVIQLRATERGLISAKDQQKWTLGLSASRSGGSNTGAGATTDTDTTINGSTTVGLALAIPINNISNQQAVATAEIALEQARISLAEQRRALVATVTQQINTLQNQLEQIDIAKKNVDFQQQTYQSTIIKQKYGKATVFELSQQKNSLVSAQISLIGARIDLLNDITAFNQTLGTVLDNWDIKLRY